jgi:glutamine amidotransferase
VTRLDTRGAKLPAHRLERGRLRRPGALTEASGRPAPSTTCTRSSAGPSEDGDVVGTGEYGERFASIVERGRVMGAQFHPEKSSRDGLALLGNFVAACATVRA